jgi:hypothetical protein
MVRNNGYLLVLLRMLPIPIAADLDRVLKPSPRQLYDVLLGASGGINFRRPTKYAFNAWTHRETRPPKLEARCIRQSFTDACDQDVAALFNFDKARTLTRTLAGLAAPFIISPVAGFRMSVPALRAGTLRKLIFKRPGKVNSPTPRGCTEPNITDSSVLKTPTAVLRGMSFCSAIRFINADLDSVCLIAGTEVTGLPGFFLAIFLQGLNNTRITKVVFQSTPKLMVLRDPLQHLETGTAAAFEVSQIAPLQATGTQALTFEIIKNATRSLVLMPRFFRQRRSRVHDYSVESRPNPIP